MIQPGHTDLDWHLAGLLVVTNACQGKVPDMEVKAQGSFPWSDCVDRITYLTWPLNDDPWEVGARTLTSMNVSPHGGLVPWPSMA